MHEPQPESRFPEQTPPGGRRWLRGLAWVVGTVLVLFVLAVALLPIGLSTPQGNQMILSHLNKVFAPGSLSIERIELSWTHPTRLTKVELRDARGGPVLTASVGQVDRSLWRMILAPWDRGTLRLEHTNLELARTPDGSENLIEALGHVFDHPDPRNDFTVHLLGNLTANDPLLPEPLKANGFDFELKLKPSPEKASWSLRLAEPSPGNPAQIVASGDFDRWRTRSKLADSPDLSARLQARGWPITVSMRDQVARGAFTGDAELQRVAGDWTSTGDLGVLVGSIKPEAQVDLLPINLALLWKSWNEKGQQKVAGKVSTERLGKVEGPLVVAFDGGYARDVDRVDLNSVGITTPWATLNANGWIEEFSGRRIADLSGTLEPDYGKLSAELAKSVEPRARIAGSPAPWKIKGPLASVSKSERPRELMISAGFSLDQVDVYGMKLSSTRFSGQLEKGEFKLEPIVGTLNGGALRLEPIVDLDAPDGPVLRLGAGSSLKNAEVNDEVSRRVLSYVAPVLNQATQVNGFVSANVSAAEFPLVKSAARKAKVEGEVLFQDVTFSAGPLTKELVGMVVQDPATLSASRLVLDEPIRLTISEGRIEHHGLGLPIGQVARIELDGWVDMDRRMLLEASLPFNPQLFSRAPMLNGVVRATRIRIPIGGTLDEPKIDKSALKNNFEKMGRDVLSEVGVQGFVNLFSTLAKPQPRDPNAPLPPPPAPRLTPEERKAKREEQKAKRMEKQAERKRQRQQNND